jgi:hypothetical protein
MSTKPKLKPKKPKRPRPDQPPPWLRDLQDITVNKEA